MRFQSSNHPRELILLSEIELKLELSKQALETLVGSGLLGEPAKILEQNSIYFDTVDRRLFDEGFTLRIRRTGELRVQTVKASGPSKSLFARSEWETVVKNDDPALDHTSPLCNEFGDDLVVGPAFNILVRRRIWNIQENGSQVEVVIDEGEAIAGDRYAPIREIELELKDGDPRDLFVLARKIDAVAPFRFGVRAKAERGFALLEKQQTVFKAERFHLERNMRTPAAFETIASACFRHFRLNEDVLLARRNREALHQARVAIRRLRSAFSMFKSIATGPGPLRLKQELRWLAGVLGEARNLDVLLATATDADLIARLKAARERAYDEAIDALESARSRTLMLDFNEWLHCGEYLTTLDTSQERGRAATEFAAHALTKMRKKMKKHGRALADVDDEHRHEVRKDAKKLRYAAEFFGSLFDDKRGARRHKHFIAAMEELQDHLGYLNDLATGPGVLETLGLQDHPARESVVLHADKETLIDQAQSALEDVLDAKRFWE
jgi:inorganic triphosphatase YgiF